MKGLFLFVSVRTFAYCEAGISVILTSSTCSMYVLVHTIVATGVDFMSVASTVLAKRLDFLAWASSVDCVSDFQQSWEKCPDLLQL